MGADGPGKAEAAGAELARVRSFRDDWEQVGADGSLTAVEARGRLYCDDWEQASHGGEFAHAVEAGGLTREDVADLGRVLTGEAEGRRTAGDITLFDSTGLAIQDLAIALAALERADDLDLGAVSL
jgi:ornithine cyclodeaminase/alanine dehydrogenase-like protein (mu-crystallin family)